MKKLEVGDRCAVYSEKRYVGTIDSIWPDGTYKVVIDRNIGTTHAHPKQVRRLVKKPRRRVWINPDALENGSSDFARSEVEDWAPFVQEKASKGRARG